jgi:hypothetical protein
MWNVVQSSVKYLHWLSTLQRQSVTVTERFSRMANNPDCRTPCPELSLVGLDAFSIMSLVELTEAREVCGAESGFWNSKRDRLSIEPKT